MSVDSLKTAIRDVPDFPKPGVMFKDITPILGDPDLFRQAIDIYAAQLDGSGVSRLAAVDARGFLFAGAIGERLGVGVVPIRKKGKLPYRTYEESYELEYGSATLAMHRDAFEPGERVALIDDLLATGGTARAAVKLIEQGGGEVVKIVFLIELAFLNGREKLSGYDVYAPIVF
jgi:adenine phosphoribosyltransferase